MQATLTILGSGTSMGVPTLGCECRVCTSPDPRDRRTRASAAIQWDGHCILIDTGPDFREQAMREKVRSIDAVLYTHAHADHILGLDDLRPLTFHHPNGHMPLYADEASARTIEKVFDYTFSTESKYPTRARVKMHRIEGHESVAIHGASFQRVPLIHGEQEVAGFRFGRAAYLTDMNAIPDASLPLLENLDVVIIDALRKKSHPSHANIDEAIKWIGVLKPRRVWFTHMSHDLHHADTERELPPHIRLAYDGLRIAFEL
ncbi:MBL fold metallo-hydrolase [Alloacidobacterium sp.]|uniref:MBL fold metallo-hydrolase n=1 Tax=Alloacidobacterium sp. TaxID=2951999 RepID=UPI002D32A37B|nr:MBL fold metallo-hydrolase [Alloacidobacterium sp.]HYK37622.1 MBL fold metallo-hydrolase [Alloacidobacterium sp.]